MEEVDWRRTWKPDLTSQPWRQLCVKHDQTYFVKANFSGNSYEILVTDLASFWYEALSEQEFKERITTLNPGIEAPLGKILSHIETSLLSDETLTLTCSSSDKLDISLNAELVGMPFTFVFEMCKSEENMGQTHLILPLMSMVGELFRQQTEMCKLLAAKDKEIDDYKSQGVKASRRHLVTTKFDELAFRNNMRTSQGFQQGVSSLGAAFTPEGQDLYRALATKRAWLTHKAEPSEHKDFHQTSEPRATSASAPSVESWASRLPTSLVNKQTSPAKSSPASSPAPSPTSSRCSSTEVSPAKNSELLRRQALERKLADDDKQHKMKKKKKLKF